LADRQCGHIQAYGILDSLSTSGKFIGAESLLELSNLILWFDHDQRIDQRVGFRVIALGEKILDLFFKPQGRGCLLARVDKQNP
jgi:hypothetical protein